MTSFFGSQTLAAWAELALEDADGARAADVVGHEDVHVHPHVVASLDMRFATGTREHFFGQSHKGDYYHTAKPVGANGFVARTWDQAARKFFAPCIALCRLVFRFPAISARGKTSVFRDALQKKFLFASVRLPSSAFAHSGFGKPVPRPRFDWVADAPGHSADAALLPIRFHAPHHKKAPLNAAWAAWAAWAP